MVRQIKGNSSIITLSYCHPSLHEHNDNCLFSVRYVERGNNMSDACSGERKGEVVVVDRLLVRCMSGIRERILA
jgi:hypothetical protein